MNNCSISIDEIMVNRNKLSVKASVTYSDTFAVPKMKIIFCRDGEIRRLPLKLINTFHRSQNGDYIAIFSYSYLINKIYTDGLVDNTDISFELYFGDDLVEDAQVIYTSSQAFEDADDSDNSNDIENTDVNVNDTIIYSVNYDAESNKFTLSSTENTTDVTKTFKYKFLMCIGNIIDFLTLICFVFFVPVFIFNALLATLGFISKCKAPPAESFKAIFIGQLKANIAGAIKAIFKGKPIVQRIIHYRERNVINYYNKMCRKPVVKNQIAFISGRRDNLSGNEEYVYNAIKDNPDIEFKFLLSSTLSRRSKNKEKKEFYKLYATSKVVIVDDYYDLLNTVEKRDEVKLFQLWHACGAFKTFGFSRIGKVGGPKQTAPNHRMYDYATVSSEGIRKYYAEGFGISDEKVLATGIPRTDIFADKDYEAKVKADFYERYPQLKNKKIIMFAPTFRGAGQAWAYYPIDAFNPNRFYEQINEEYAIIIKLHPFCKEKFVIEDKYKDYIIDLSEEDELNDLLFVTDLLITDYSSAVFEASLLNIPMVFYAFDLYQYISDRDFYCDFETFVPGKIVFNQADMASTINTGEFETEKIEPFKHKFFTDLDGKSTQRVADAVLKALKD